MSKIGIIIGREYMTRVKKKSFVILTILMPFLMVGIVAAPILLGSIKGDDTTEVAVIDATGRYAPLFVDAQKADSTRADGYTFTVTDAPLASFNTEDNPVGAVVCITDNLLEHPRAVKIYSRSEVQNDLLRYVDDLLGKKVREDKVSAYGMPELEKIISDVEADFSVQTVKWGKDGEETFSSNEVAMMLGMITALLIYMFVLSYGAMVMQSVMEEKTNRIVEVIVGSVRPFELMMGKIIGIMLVGVTQMVVWLAMVTSLFTILGISAAPSVPAASMTAEAMEMAREQPALEIMTALSSMPVTEIIVMFFLFFFGGYLLYSSFYAAIGAAINSQEDSSQFMMPMMIVMVFSIYAAMGSLENTDGPLAFWASMFPLSSPIVMMVRLPFGVPLWQEILSLVILYATVFLFVWISGRIYRVGILLYGKKPTLREMIKWMSYK